MSETMSDHTRWRCCVALRTVACLVAALSLPHTSARPVERFAFPEGYGQLDGDLVSIAGDNMAAVLLRRDPEYTSTIVQKQGTNFVTTALRGRVSGLRHDRDGCHVLVTYTRGVDSLAAVLDGHGNVLWRFPMAHEIADFSVDGQVVVTWTPRDSSRREIVKFALDGTYLGTLDFGVAPTAVIALDAVSTIVARGSTVTRFELGTEAWSERLAFLAEALQPLWDGYFAVQQRDERYEIRTVDNALVHVHDPRELHQRFPQFSEEFFGKLKPLCLGDGQLAFLDPTNTVDRMFALDMYGGQFGSWPAPPSAPNGFRLLPRAMEGSLLFVDDNVLLVGPVRIERER